MSKMSRQTPGGPPATPRTAASGAAVRRLVGSVLIAVAAMLGLLAMHGWGDGRGTALPREPNASGSPDAFGSGAAAARRGHAAARDAAPAQRTHAGHAHAGTLRIVCAETGVDVACSRIVLRSLAEGVAGDEVAEGAGMQIALPDEQLGELVTVEVVASGYARLRARWLATAGENRVALTPSGSVSVRCVDAAGQPVAGVRVALLPATLPHGAAGLDDYSFDWAELATASQRAAPDDELPQLVLRDGTWQLREVPWQLDPMRRVAATLAGFGDWVQTSGKDGVAAWRGVPVASGYRWGLLPPRLGRVEPEHEQVQYRIANGRIEVQDPPPYGLSGRFNVVRDEACEHRVEMHAPGSVRGFVAAPSGSTSAAVRLYRVVTVAGGGDNVGLMAFEFAATVQTGEAQDYRFSFTELPSGNYVVRANWMQHGQDVYFANRSFAVAAGESIDLGGVQPLDQPHALTVRLGVSVDGKRQPCGVVYPDVERPLVHLYFEVVPDSRRPEHSVCELMALPLDAEFRFHGLPGGRVIARANAVPGQGVDGSTIAKVGRGDFEQPLGQIAGKVHVDLVATSGVRRELQIVDANGLPLAAPSIWVRRCDALGRCVDAPQSLALQWQQVAGGGQLASEVSLPAGDYELACRVAAEDSGLGMFGTVRASFGAAAKDASPITLPMLPASRASGRAFPRGGDAGVEVLHWRAVTGLEAEAHGWPVSARCDERGAFVLLGIPPGARLIGQGGTPDIDAPQMGLDQVGLRLELTNSTARR